MPQHLDHVSITVRRLDAARPFYDAVMQVLGLATVGDGALLYGLRNRADDDGHTYVTVRASLSMRPDDGRHGCRRAPDRAAFEAFHASGLAHGGHDACAPGLRARSNPHDDAAFLYDPDGNKIEAVCHAAVE